jgi:hypothetical protein
MWRRFARSVLPVGAVSIIKFCGRVPASARVEIGFVVSRSCDFRMAGAMVEVLQITNRHWPSEDDVFAREGVRTKLQLEIHPSL